MPKIYHLITYTYNVFSSSNMSCVMVIVVAVPVVAITSSNSISDVFAGSAGSNVFFLLR